MHRLQERLRPSFHIAASTDIVLTTAGGARAGRGEEEARSSAEDGEGDGTLRDRAKRKKEKKMSKEQREKEAAKLLRQAEDQAAALLGVLSLARDPLSPSPPFPFSLSCVNSPSAAFVCNPCVNASVTVCQYQVGQVTDWTLLRQALSMVLRPARLLRRVCAV